MGNHIKKRRHDVSRQVKDAMERGDWAEVARILSECSRRDSDSVMTQLVSRDQWGAVKQVIRCVGDEERTWNIGGVLVKNNILLSRTEGYWRGIGEMPHERFLHSTFDWILQQACTHAKQAEIVQYVLPHCEDDQLDSVLTTVVKLRLWWAVIEVLERGVSDSVKRWAVEVACAASDQNFITQHILPHCADDQLDSVLTTLVERRLWQAVSEVLRQGVSHAVKQWAVMEACTVCDDADSYVLYHILCQCADDQLDSVLTTLVERRQWQAVGKVLKRCVSDSFKRWAVDEACVASDQNFITQHILPHCADDQLDSVLTTLVGRRLWRAVGEVLKRCDSDGKKQWAQQKTCKHCSSLDAYFSSSHVVTADSPKTRSSPFNGTDGNLNPFMSALTEKETCIAVRNVKGKENSDAERRDNIKTAFQLADEHTLTQIILPYYVYDSMHLELKMLASRGFWSAFVELLHSCIIDTLYKWAVETDPESTDELFWDMIRNPCDGVKGLTPAMWRLVTWSGLQRSLKQLLDWDTPLCEVLCESLLAFVRELWLSGREKKTYITQQKELAEVVSTVEHLQQQIKPFLVKGNTSYELDLSSSLDTLPHNYAESCCERSLYLQMRFIKYIVLQYYKRQWDYQQNALEQNAILVVLTIYPVVPDVQSVALRVMLRHKRWDVIRHACLSGVCEQDRRQLFQAAVKQRQWSAVKRWADHTLYDDQRLWALGEARQEKRWDVYLKLADHGLSEWERVGVLFRVTMHADWKLVRHMLRTVADVTDMIDLLTNTPGVLSKLGAKNYEQRMNELKVFENNLKKDTHALKTLKTMAKRGKWWVLLHNIRHTPNLQHARRALKAAVSSEAWHAVMQLVRLETDVTRRDSLFRDMVRLRQWAVCRELLEQGVSRRLCLELLSELLEHSQWWSVAVVMECPMDDERRKKIMHQAIMMREGSVVWECINNMQTRLSVKKRKDMFQLTFNREVWQAVKPLIEEKDVTGIRHRDTALLEAIEQHQWDVVDHCQRHHADINMKDNDGHTPIHRAARKEDWEAVKELTVRDGDPNLLDSEGLSVLHRAIRAKQWDAVKLLIQFHGDIHQPAQHRQSRNDSGSRTPLQMLIDAHQGDVIESSLMWCPDQQKGVNKNRETALHAVCLSGRPGALYHLVARKVNPLAVTKRRHTALCYAVLCKDVPQRMVAECIKLGFGTHQPRITEAARTEAHFWYYAKTEPRMLMSPLMLAVIRGLPVVTQMLYESGACSSRELFQLSICVSDLTDDAPYTGKAFLGQFNEMWRRVYCNAALAYSFDKERMQQSADYLREMCSTPRSLMSTCRLVISRCLTLSKTRHRDIAQLPLSPMMKNYLMFFDLTDPRYPDLSYRGKE